MLAINKLNCFQCTIGNICAYTHTVKNGSFSPAESTDMLGLYIANFSSYTKTGEANDP